MRMAFGGLPHSMDSAAKSIIAHHPLGNVRFERKKMGRSESLEMF
ncbi:MAG: hypothetical protein V1929_12775 [bacterium]